MWGFGGLTFGLTMRYLGMSLGMGVALGYCAAFGTLLPPIFKTFVPEIPVSENIVQIAATFRPRSRWRAWPSACWASQSRRWPGMNKEKEMTEEEKKKTIAEFNFVKGILVATFSGIMSACFSFGLTAGNPIAERPPARPAPPRCGPDLPKLVVVLLGGFTTNFIWCVLLNIRNRTRLPVLLADAATGAASTRR